MPGIWPRLFAWQLRKSHPIYIDAPPYDPRSGGSRALHLLCHYLNRAGYDAFLTLGPGTQVPPLPVRHLTGSDAEQHQRQERAPVVVYPEVTIGNPRGEQYVVRYLLNKPGLLAPGAASSFGAKDYFVAFSGEHVPPGAHAFDLFMPLVDRSCYFPPAAGAARRGFALFTHRARVDPAGLPGWLSPHTLLSMQAPRSHAELGEVYRSSRAMVTWERSSAIYEALACGCPVICISGEHFEQATYQLRFRGAGLVWGWHESALDAAQRRTAEFMALYGGLERDVVPRIRQAFDGILRDVRARSRAEPARVAGARKAAQ